MSNLWAVFVAVLAFAQGVFAASEVYLKVFYIDTRIRGPNDRVLLPYAAELITLSTFSRRAEFTLKTSEAEVNFRLPAAVAFRNEIETVELCAKRADPMVRLFLLRPVFRNFYYFELSGNRIQETYQKMKAAVNQEVNVFYKLDTLAVRPTRMKLILDDIGGALSNDGSSSSSTSPAKVDFQRKQRVVGFVTEWVGKLGDSVFEEPGVIEYIKELFRDVASQQHLDQPKLMPKVVQLMVAYTEEKERAKDLQHLRKWTSPPSGQTFKLFTSPAGDEKGIKGWCTMRPWDEIEFSLFYPGNEPVTTKVLLSTSVQDIINQAIKAHPVEKLPPVEPEPQQQPPTGRLSMKKTKSTPSSSSSSSAQSAPPVPSAPVSAEAAANASKVVLTELKAIFSQNKSEFSSRRLSVAAFTSSNGRLHICQYSDLSDLTWPIPTQEDTSGRGKKKENTVTKLNLNLGVEIMAYTADEVAYHLTMLEWNIFTKIPAYELLSRVEDLKKITANLDIFLRRFDETKLWVATQIALTPKVADRVEVINRFMELAVLLFTKYQNINAAFAIVMGFMSPPIDRLNNTWEKVGKSNAAYWELHQRVQPERNSVGYKELIDNMKAPFIPYFNPYLTALEMFTQVPTFLNQDAVDAAKGKGGVVPVVNTNKMVLVSKSVYAIWRGREGDMTTLVSPNPTNDDRVRAYVRDRQYIHDDRILQQISLELEP